MIRFLTTTLLLALLPSCVFPRYTVTVPAIALVALAGGDVAAVPADAPPLIAETVWFDRSVDISFTTPDGRTIKIATIADATAAVEARQNDGEIIATTIDTATTPGLP